jgi:hypothetical protein
MPRCRFGVSLLRDFDQPVQAVSDIQKCKRATSNKGGYQKRSDTPDDGKQKTAREAPTTTPIVVARYTPKRQSHIQRF